MSWASQRRAVILFIIGAIVVALGIILSVTVFYETPSCTDKKQNQGEYSVDCGGPCAFLCTAQAQSPVALFTKALTNSNGRVDVVAEIVNKNSLAAAKNVPYTITLYGIGSTTQTVSGTVDLPPAATTAIYLPGVASAAQTTVRAFLTFDAAAPHWFTMTNDQRVRPVVSNTTISNVDTTPRVDAMLTNDSTIPLANIPVIVFIHDEQGDVIAASQTILPRIPAQGQAAATFTWNSPFSSPPTTIEILPIIALP